MNFFNLGIGEIVFILIIAVIVFGPKNMVKTARDIGAFLRKVTKSPYWQEVWATRRDLTELPKMIAKEAQLDDTIRDLNKETRGMKSSIGATVSDFIKEVDTPLKEVDKDLKSEPVTKVEVVEPAPKEPEIKPD